MTLLGAFNDLFALQIFLATMVSSVAVLVLGRPVPPDLDGRRRRRQPQSACTRIWSSSTHHGPSAARNTARSPTTGRRPASNPLSNKPVRTERHQLVAEAKEHRSGRVGADRCASGGYPAEDVVARGQDPRRRRTGQSVVAVCVEVAPTDRHGPGVPGQPPRQRATPVVQHRQRVPRRVPDLRDGRRVVEGHPPAAVRRQRVVHRQDSATGLDVALPLRTGVAEVDEPDVSQRVRVPSVGRDLLPGDQPDAVALPHRGQVCVMAGRVVVGHRQRVETTAHRQGGELLDPEGAVRVERVGVEVGGQPPHPVDVRELPARPAFGQRWRLGLSIPLRRHLCGGGRPDGQPVVDPRWRDPVQPDQHLPRPRPIPGSGGSPESTSSSLTRKWDRAPPDQPT